MWCTTPLVPRQSEIAAPLSTALLPGKQPCCVMQRMQICCIKFALFTRVSNPWLMITRFRSAALSWVLRWCLSLAVPSCHFALWVVRNDTKQQPADSWSGIRGVCVEINGNGGLKPSHVLNIIPKGCFFLSYCHEIKWVLALQITLQQRKAIHEFLLWMQRRGKQTCDPFRARCGFTWSSEKELSVLLKEQ